MKHFAFFLLVLTARGLNNLAQVFFELGQKVYGRHKD